jgi:hypothetical protein
MYVAANSGKKSEVCVSESDIAGDEMNALACVANSGCISASGAGVSHTNSKRCNNKHAKRPRKQHSGRQDYGPIDCVPACCCVCDEVDDDCVLVDNLFAFVPAIAILPRLLVQIVAA